MSRGRWKAVVVVVGVAGMAAWHYWTLANSLDGARDSLVAAQNQINDVGIALEEADIAIAQSHLNAARGDLDTARGHMRWDPIVQIAGVLPGSGEQVDAAEELLDIADLLIEVGDEAASAGSKAVAFRESPPEGQPLTGSLIELLDATSPEVDRIDALLEEVLAHRMELGDEALIAPLDSARASIDDELPRLINAVEQLQNARGLLPGFFGYEGDRRYLVIMLNGGELLPGGGLVTASGVMAVSSGVNGPLDVADSVAWRDQALALGVPYIEPPAPLERYLLRDYTWNLLVSNWSPDFTTWSQQALEFYELVHGEQDVDGMLAVDTLVLQRLLEVTGPRTIEVEGVGPVEFTSSNAVFTLEALTRAPYDEGADRKSVVGDLATALMTDLLALPPEKWGDAVRIVRDLGEQRHIQLFSFDAAEQTAVRDFRWDGRLEEPEGDFMHFNEASVLSTKLNLIIQPEGSYRVSIGELGDVQHELTLRYVNTLPEWSEGKDPQLVSQLMLGGLYGGYLRVFGPRGISGFDVLVDGQPAGVEDFGSDGDTDWFGKLITVASGESREVTFRWRSSAPEDVTEEGYRLYMQKQPGTYGLCLALSVTRLGEEPETLDVDGGALDESGRVCLVTDVKAFARF